MSSGYCSENLTLKQKRITCSSDTDSEISKTTLCLSPGFSLQNKYLMESDWQDGGRARGNKIYLHVCNQRVAEEQQQQLNCYCKLVELLTWSMIQNLSSWLSKHSVWCAFDFIYNSFSRLHLIATIDAALKKNERESTASYNKFKRRMIF